MTNKGWVFAGKLHVGDKVREKGGYYGTVQFSKTIDRTQTMYHLTVATARLIRFMWGAGSGWCITLGAIYGNWVDSSRLKNG